MADSEPGSEVARNELRASHEDRDRVVELLRVSAGDGRLTAEELDERLELALTARTYGELAKLVSDLPAAGSVASSPTPRAKDVVRIDCGSGHAKRDGQWVIPQRIEARVRSGHLKLDFTQAVITQPSLQLDAEVRSGHIILITKPGIVVDTDDVAVRSGHVRVRVPWGPDVPELLRIEVTGRVGSGHFVARPQHRTFWQWLTRQPRPYEIAARLSRDRLTGLLAGRAGLMAGCRGAHPPRAPGPRRSRGQRVLRVDTAMTPAEARHLAQIQAELSRLIRYDDESVVHELWIRQRYDLGAASSFAPARTAAVRTAWHEAGHAVAALAVGARFSSASIRHGSTSQGRVHGVSGGGEQAFVIDAAGQIAERLRDWSMLTGDDQLRAWLPTWRGDGGDARRFRRAIRARFGDDDFKAWRYCEQALTPLRPRIRRMARALLVHPRPLPYEVAAAIADGG